MWAESVVWRGCHLVSHGVTIVYVKPCLYRVACSAMRLSPVSTLSRNVVLKSGRLLSSLIDAIYYIIPYIR